MGGHLWASKLLITCRVKLCDYTCAFRVSYLSIDFTPFTTLFSTHRRTQEFCSVGGGGGVQQIQLRIEDRENRDLGAVDP